MGLEGVDFKGVSFWRKILLRAQGWGFPPFLSNGKRGGGGSLCKILRPKGTGKNKSLISYAGELREVKAGL